MLSEKGKNNKDNKNEWKMAILHLLRDAVNFQDPVKLVLPDKNSQRFYKMVFFKILNVLSHK